MEFNWHTGQTEFPVLNALNNDAPVPFSASLYQCFSYGSFKYANRLLFV